MNTPSAPQKYYVPEPTVWPFVLTVALFATAASACLWLNGVAAGPVALAASLLLVAVATFVWFRAVVRENVAGLYLSQEDRTFRWSMAWFIFAELTFFGVFFGALFYVRLFTLPSLSGGGDRALTGVVLWPQFAGQWPSNGPEHVGGNFQPVSAWGGPLISTVIMLSSSVTLTWAQWGLNNDNRVRLCLGVAMTLILGIAFLGFQGIEYYQAYQDLGLTLGTGIYGATFFGLSGLDAAHVLLGVIMLAVILLRGLRGHFSPRGHFGVDAVTWYWHFVDVIWLALFVSVYIM